MIPPLVLDNVLCGLSALHDTPGWVAACSTVISPDSNMARAVTHGDSAEHVVLATLLCVRDASVLYLAATHPARIAGLLALIEATADRVGVRADVQHIAIGVNVRFQYPEAVAA